MGTTIGADIRGFDLKSLTTAEYRFIRRAWLDHLVLRIRGQSFGDDEHVAFARMFGDLERPARVINTGRGLHAGYPEISVISNITEKGVPIGSLGDGELVWHSDMSFVERPPAASLLHALEVPRLGGDTGFLNMYAVYEDVPPELKSAIVGKSIKHENVHGSDMRVRPGVREPDSGDVRDYPGAVHPIVRTHPETGRQALYLGRRCNAYILDLPIDESEELLDRLWALAERSGKVFTQKWEIGDLIIWDNRCVMHRRAGFDAAMRRRMHRVVIGGEKPFYEDGRSPVAAI
ncbi:MAG: TauD/TfdA dioxygenase family protein [Alphaproteobacteria bacterium]